MNNKEHIEQIIERTYNIVQLVFDYQQESNPTQELTGRLGSRIIFPQYRNGQTRFSEQELRFVFVEQLNIEIQRYDWDVYYSVETPTKFRYKFKDEDMPLVFKDEEKGQSAQFDLVIHDNKFNRIAIIEFKANNAPAAHHNKDFLKLKEESSDSTLAYFLEIVKCSNNGTINSLKAKTENHNGVFRCWSCNEKKLII